MPMDAGSVMKARPRADLRAALKAASRTEVRTIRALITAIDNAEAPPVPASETAKVQHRFRSESAEVERLLLISRRCVTCYWRRSMSASAWRQTWIA